MTLPCEEGKCTERAVMHLAWAAGRRCKREQHLCEKHAKSVLATHDFSKSAISGIPTKVEGATRFDIELIIISEVRHEQVVYLREVGGKRFFPILIGIFEATALDRNLKGFQAPRPLTHDAMLAAIRALDAEVQDVVIADFRTDVFYTHLRIRRNFQIVLVDLRPSDAFVLSVLANKPIFVAERVLAKIDLHSTDKS